MVHSACTMADRLPASTSGDERPFLAVLSAAQAGDGASREELFRRFYPRVERIVHRSLSTDLRSSRPWLTARFSTGDVVQEVFRSLLTDLSGFLGRTEDDFVGYLAMVARNRLLDAIRYHEAARRDGRCTLGVEEGASLGVAEHDGPQTEVASNEETALFHEVLASMPEREQLLLRARIEQGARFQDLANQLGYGSVWAARRAFYAAQAQLAIRLRRRGSK